MCEKCDAINEKIIDESLVRKDRLTKFYQAQGLTTDYVFFDLALMAHGIINKAIKDNKASKELKESLPGVTSLMVAYAEKLRNLAIVDENLLHKLVN